MPNAFQSLLCLKLCRRNRLGLTQGYRYQEVTAILYVVLEYFKLISSKSKGNKAENS